MPTLLQRPRHHPASAQRGQSVVEFALVFPILILLIVAIADFARYYTSAIAIESAVREAADFGSFQATNWDDVIVDANGLTNKDKTESEMWVRVCSAASSLPDYVGDPPGTPGMTCANPAMVANLTPADPACTNSNTEPPCELKVTVTYTFRLILGIPPMPESVTFDRSSTFALSSLDPGP